MNYVDHESQFHMRSAQITGYLYDPANPNARDICGWATINSQPEKVMFRVRLVDNGEPGRNDTFGITIDNWHTAGERIGLHEQPRGDAAQRPQPRRVPAEEGA